MPANSVKDIANALGAECVGQGDLAVIGACEPADATADQLAVAMTPKFADDLPKGGAVAAILWAGADWQSFGLKAAILVDRPRLAMAGLTEFLRPTSDTVAGIHPTAVIDASASIAPDASIAAFVVIGPDVRIGKSAQIGPHVSIGAGAVLGDGCILQSGVKIASGVTIGDRLFAHPGVCIGADGFSFVTREKSNSEAARETLGDTSNGQAGQDWIKIHSLGGVSIGDDVEIGANSNIDAGTIRATAIGSGTKIDSLVQIGHNVTIGRKCLLCAQVGVAGSTTIGDAVVLGGQVGVVDNISLGNGVVVGGGSTVLSNVPAGRAMMGSPAVKMEQYFASYQAIRRLPRLMRELAAVKKPVPKDAGRD